MTCSDPQIVAQAIKLLDRGLDYHMSASARGWAENGLRLLKSGDIESGVESICNAAAICDAPLAIHYLHQVRELLAPERLASA